MRLDFRDRVARVTAHQVRQWWRRSLGARVPPRQRAPRVARTAGGRVRTRAASIATFTAEPVRIVARRSVRLVLPQSLGEGRLGPIEAIHTPATSNSRRRSERVASQMRVLRSAGRRVAHMALCVPPSACRVGGRRELGRRERVVGGRRERGVRSVAEVLGERVQDGDKVGLYGAWVSSG